MPKTLYRIQKPLYTEAREAKFKQIEAGTPL